MVWPEATPVMVLSDITLFPHSMLPLTIFESRYRAMLKHVLETDRMFCVAMPDLSGTEETPVQIAGLGLVRAAVANPDGTSNLILQGLTRVQLLSRQSQTPYPLYLIQPIETGFGDRLVEDALIQRLMELVSERLSQGSHSNGFQLHPQIDLGLNALALDSLKHNIDFLNHSENREQLADLISCTLLSNPRDKQAILEAQTLEARLSRLVQLLLEDLDLGQS